MSHYHPLPPRLSLSPETYELGEGMTGDEITSISGSLQFLLKPGKRVLKFSWGLQLMFRLIKCLSKFIFVHFSYCWYMPLLPLGIISRPLLKVGMGERGRHPTDVVFKVMKVLNPGITWELYHLITCCKKDTLLWKQPSALFLLATQK